MITTLKKVNEASYIQTQRPDVPYLITKITDIKVSKAGHAEFVTRPFHRVDDLPYHIYQKLHHERQTEFASNDNIQEKLARTSFTRRELFICDAEDAQRNIDYTLHFLAFLIQSKVQLVKELIIRI